MANESLTAGPRSASSEERDLFLLMLVHDIRTPLASIAGLLEHARELNHELNRGGAGCPASAEQDELLGLAQGETRHLLDLTGDLLEMGRLRGAPVPLEPAPVADLDDLVHQAVLDALGHRPAANVRVQIDPRARSLTADRTLLRRILANLLRNAGRHAGEGGTIRLEVAVSGDDVIFSVEDDGPGIPAGSGDSIFRPFVRMGGAAGGRSGGSGLGLAFCKAAVAEHGGRIWVEEGEAGGGRLRFSLPLGGPV